MTRMIAMLLATLLSSSVSAQTLERRAYLGVLAAAVDENAETGVLVQRVFDNSTASANGLEAGHILLTANGQTLRAPDDLPLALQGLRGGDQAEFSWLDGEVLVSRNIQLRPFPEEQRPGSELVYGAIPTDSGLQRSILTLPPGVANPPVVYVLQGFDCSSVDLAFRTGSALDRLIDELAVRGYATFRLEKSGVGDSSGKPCLGLGFEEETRGFQAGLTALKGLDAIDSDRIFLLGISLGGVWAPILAAEEDVAGIISFGTIAKTWQEYMADNWRRQWRLAGKSFASIDRDLKLASVFWHGLVSEGLSPESIFNSYPKTQSLSAALAYDPVAETILNRHYSFVAELARHNIMGAWSEVPVPSLLLWGEGDYVASEQDQQLILSALTSNQTPADLIYVASDHYWRQASTFAEAWTNARESLNAPLQDAIYRHIGDFLQSL